MPRFLICFLVSMSVTLVTACQPYVNSGECDGSIAIHNVTLIDAQGVRNEQTVVIRNARIESIQPSAKFTPPAGQVIDGHERYLIPGLWDFHVHLTYDDRLSSDTA